MSRFARCVFLAAVLVAGWISTVHAVVPNRISYQGFLTNAAGTPVNATVTMQFRLFDVPTGGSPAWSETQSVTVANGLFNVVLGAVVTIFVPFDKQYYLEMQVDPDPPMTPRQALQSVPYAAAAGFAGCGIGDYINCYSGPAGTEGVGQCKAGRRTCNPTTLTFGVCTGSIGPSTEVIDGIDNDCDGAIDNVDGPPSVSNVTSSTANGTYGFNQPINILVTFNEPVTVNQSGGPIQLALNSGGPAAFTGGSGTATLAFQYQVGAGHNSPDLDYTSSSALTVPPGSTIRDSTNNDAVLTLPAPGAAGSLGFNKAIVIDTAGAAVTSVTSATANGTYGAGSAISVQVTFSEPVFVGGLPQLALNSGGIAYHASGSGTATQTFTYTVAAGHNNPDLDYTSTSALSLAGGSISDSALNSAVLALPPPGATGSLGANKAIVIDTSAPLALTVTITPTGGGTVTSAPSGIACGADCSETYASGTVVSLTASPAGGWTFSGWGGACSGNLACNVTMDVAKSVSASFYQNSTGGLMINEVDYDTASTDTAEFIEIYNASATVSLANFAVVLVDGAANSGYLTVNLGAAVDGLGAAVTTLPPGGFVVIGNAAMLSSLPSSTARIQIADSIIQNGAPDGIALVDTSTGTLVDSLSYEGAIVAATLGVIPGTFNLVNGTATTAIDSGTGVQSLCRYPNGVKTGNDSADWFVCSSITPGAPNLP